MGLAARNSGMTLVEMLIATVILTGMISLATFSYSYFSNYWQRQEHKSRSLFEFGITLTEIKRVISGMTPFNVRNGLNDFGTYFKGSGQFFYAVSSMSIRDPSKAAVFFVSIRTNADDDSWVLTYKESMLDRFRPDELNLLPQPFDFVTEITVPGNRPNLSYLGWPKKFNPEFNAHVVSAVFDLKEAEWLDNYDGNEHQSIPSAVKLSFLNQGNRVQWVNRTSDMLPELMPSIGAAE